MLRGSLECVVGDFGLSRKVPEGEEGTTASNVGPLVSLVWWRNGVAFLILPFYSVL
jgi:hypothetical protein